MTVTITVDPAGVTSGKLADAELHFDAADGVLRGLKLVGFSLWERRTGAGRFVTFPARTYSRLGARHSYALLRPIADQDAGAYALVRAAVLDAYDRYLIQQTRLN